MDIVNKPAHYNKGEIEAMDAIFTAIKGLPPEEAYTVGNVIKYVWRYDMKGGKTDLLKASYYLNKTMELYEKRSAISKPTGL
jgi:hypothetical protein